MNFTSLVGGVLAILGLGASTLLLCLDFLGGPQRPYTGILTFLVFPAVLILGLILVPLGALLQRRRLHKGGADLPRHPIVDLNHPPTRRLLLSITFLTLVILLLSVLGGYKAYEFTESVTFCGELCHSVMEPEHTAFLDSPHARVKCVECHVGGGAESYLRAKISGIKQVRGMITGDYPRPIPAPVEGMRSAQDICMECHWPSKPFGDQVLTRTLFEQDRNSTRREFQVVMKTGGADRNGGRGEGIHWHANPANRIEIAFRDSQRNQIPWFRVTVPGKEPVVYTDPEKPVASEELATVEHRIMDCVDCHNRPAHRFHSPEAAVDLALEACALEASLPFAKATSIAVLAEAAAEFTPADASWFEARLKDYFAQKHPGLVAEATAKFPAASKALEQIYARNFFPRMKAGWASYPDHSGHKEFAGCLRCHDGKHKSLDGATVSGACDLCHTFVARAQEGQGYISLPADASFVHPWKHAKHSQIECWSCHTGKSSPYETCSKCHEIEPTASMATLACASCHKPMKVTADKTDCIPCHDTAQSKMHSTPGHIDCVLCHKQHEWKTVDYPDDCTSSCHKNLKDPHHPGEACVPCHDFKGVTSLLVSLPSHWGASK